MRGLLAGVDPAGNGEERRGTPQRATGATFERWTRWRRQRPSRKGLPVTVHKTRIALASNARKVSIDVLNARLADAIDLALLTKQAHWNLKGPQFIAIHEMLDQFRATLNTHVDTIAERAVQLGGMAQGTSQVVAGTSTLKPYPTDISKTKDHLAALIERYATAANAVREAIDQTEEAGDAGTADIFTAFSRELDKSLWFLEAHVQEKE
jgi:starvation-inducible DNA-binding protein